MCLKSKDFQVAIAHAQERHDTSELSFFLFFFCDDIHVWVQKLRYKDEWLW